MVNNVSDYFKHIQKEVERTHKIASLAKEKGLDPSTKVEVHLARNLAERVIGLVSSMYPQVNDERIVKRIIELEKEFGMLDFAVAFKIAEEIAKKKFCKFQSLKEAIDAAIRIGFSYITVGVVSSPLEGYTHWEIKKTRMEKDYMCMYYSGPVRSAGGTNGSVSIMIGDYLREVFGYAKYDPTEDEIKRTVHE